MNKTANRRFGGVSTRSWGPPMFFPKSDTQMNAFVVADLLVEAIILGDYKGRFQSLEQVLEYGIDREALDAYYAEKEPIFGKKYETHKVVNTYQAYLFDKLEEQKEAQYIADLFFFEQDEPNIPPKKKEKKQKPPSLPDLDDLL